MGCAECKYCKQEEENNQFEYKNDTHAIQNSLHNSLQKNKNNNNFAKEFEDKIQSIGQIISEDEFENLIPQETKKYINENPFSNIFILKNSNSKQMKPVQFENGNVFYGQWNEDFEMEGYGKYFLTEEKVLAEGVWEKGGLKYARIFFPNGDYYEGEILNSVYNGKGKIIYQNGDEYTGQFVEGEKNGEGKIIFNDDKTEYTGNFVKNNFSGKGHMKWANGIEYDGNFNDNYLDGEGVLFNTDGEKYEGNFQKNVFHGKGKYTYFNRDEYEGDFEYGIRKGKGIYRNKYGLTFEGIWDNNVPNGYGKIIHNDNVIKCNFHIGKIIDDPICENGSFNEEEIDFNFYNEPMNLLANKLSHLENDDGVSNQYGAPGSSLSFLEEEEE